MKHAAFRNARRGRCAAWLVCALVAFGTSLSTQAGDVVGEVSLVLGKAWLHSAGASQAVRRGAAVSVGDEILTEANGHVHIRFVDQALVGVRPRSRLEITAYDYHPGQPARSTVGFNLVEGVTRSISGEAGRAARDRFRLDTPIAAIGVRGTDFVVSASQRNVRALVNEGAIVVAPYSADCLSGGIGPCVVGGVELAGGGMQILELNQGDLQPVLRLLHDQEAQDLLERESERYVAEAEEGGANASEVVADVYQGTITVRRVEDQVRSSISSERDAVARLPRDATPAVAVSSAELLERQLVWGRFSEAGNTVERISVPYEQAHVARQVTVGDGAYGLFREAPAGAEAVVSGLGVVGFELAMAQAFHHGAAGSEAMRVDSGELQIDFNSNRFETQLLLHAEATGLLNYSASGAISSRGFFNSRSAQGIMAGAVSLDGGEAGYFFEQQIGSGVIQGLTLWGQGQ